LEFLPNSTSSPLSRSEFRSRILSTDGEQRVLLQKAGLVVRYAFVSLRGCGLVATSEPSGHQKAWQWNLISLVTCRYYPEALDKANQVGLVLLLAAHCSLDCMDP
jgi:hypothetical protein